MTTHLGGAEDICTTDVWVYKTNKYRAPLTVSRGMACEHQCFYKWNWTEVI